MNRNPADPSVRKWHHEQRETGRATQAARAYGLLNSIMATAVAEGRLATNPCKIRGAQNATTGREVFPPTDAQLLTILEAITPRYRAAVILAAWAALRFGELTELRRKDLQLVFGDNAEVKTIIVNVDRAVTHTTGEGFVVGKTKSAAGVRRVALPPRVNGVIVDHLLEHVETGLESLLFPARGGVTHLAQSTFTMHWYPAGRVAGRPDMPWHALRHHGATKFAQAGATLRENQARLGHSTVPAAMRYQHAAEDRDAELAARM